MANKKKFYGKRMVPEYLITKLETMEPGGGSEYTAGTGIDIEDNEISIDNTVALKSEIPTNADYVDLTSAQTITGEKTFLGDKLVKFKGTKSTDKLGFTGYDKDDNEVGFLEMKAKNPQTSSIGSNLLGIYRDGQTLDSEDKHLGFRYYNNKGSDDTRHAYYLVVPPLYDCQVQTTVRYMPIDFTDGTNVVRADDEGVVDISNLLPTIPTNVSSFTNDAGYITSSALSGYATETWVGNQGYITGITSGDVTTALGYTPGTSNFSGDYSDLTNTPTIPTTATSSSSVTPSTVQLTFTYSDNTTETITLMTGASVTTTTTLS